MANLVSPIPSPSFSQIIFEASLDYISFINQNYFLKRKTAKLLINYVQTTADYSCTSIPQYYVKCPDKKIFPY